MTLQGEIKEHATGQRLIHYIQVYSSRMLEKLTSRPRYSLFNLSQKKATKMQNFSTDKIYRLLLKQNAQLR